MADTLKRHIAQRVMSLIREAKRDPTLDRARCETVLRNLGMKAGNAQRLLDESTDVQMSRVDEAAALLGVKPAALLPGWLDGPPSAPSPSPPPLEEALRVVVDEVTTADEVTRPAIVAALHRLLDDPSQLETTLPLLALLRRGASQETGAFVRRKDPA